jgi:hypothetical protein
VLEETQLPLLDHGKVALKQDKAYAHGHGRVGETDQHVELAHQPIVQPPKPHQRHYEHANHDYGPPGPGHQPDHGQRHQTDDQHVNGQGPVVAQ